MKCLIRTLPKVLLLLFFLATLFVLPVHAETDNSSLGILHIRSQAPMQSLRMVMPLISAGSIKPGWGLFLAGAWTNVWADETSYYLDYEMLDTRAAISYGVNEKLGISLAYDNRSYFGGTLDGFIQGFHSTFGLDQPGRKSVSKNLSRVGQIGENAGESDADIFRNSGATLVLSYDLTPGDKTWPAVNISTAIRYGLETGKAFPQNHPVDYGFSVGLAKRWAEKWYSHVILSYTFYDMDRGRDVPGFTDIRMEDQQLGSFFSVGYDYSDQLKILVQYMRYEAAVKDIKGLDEASNEVHLGFKYLTEKLGTFEFGLIENIINMDNTPDFGMNLGWQYHF